MSAGSYDIAADQYATFTLALTWQDSTGAPINLTGCAALMQVRDPAGNLIIELSTVNGRIVLGGSAGTIVLTIPAGVIALAMLALPAGSPGRWQYDLLLTSAGGIVTRLIAGLFIAGPGASVPGT